MILPFYMNCYKGPDPLLLDWALVAAPFWWNRGISELWAATDRVSSLHLCPSPPRSLSPPGQEGAVRGMCLMGAEGMGGLLSGRLISGSQGAAEQIAEVYAY